MTDATTPHDAAREAFANAACDEPAAQRLEGQRIPSVELRMLRDSEVVAFPSDELFADRRVVAFGLPGAFTPTCSSAHVPRFVELEPELRAQGIDALICLAVNDAYVLHAWQRDQQAQSITFAADGNGDLHRALGLLVDLRHEGLGMRARRYAMVVRDRVIELALIEPDAPDDPYGVSSADGVLARIAPTQARVHDIVVFTRALCRHSERAKRLLERNGLRFDAVDLKPRGILAVSGHTSTPQVFVNGRLIGGCDALERWLDSGARID